VALTETYTGTAARPLDRPLVLRHAFQAAVLAGNVTLTRLHPRCIALDPGGAARTIGLPTNGKDGDAFDILNTADGNAETLTVDALTIIPPGGFARFGCVAGTWVLFGRSYGHGVSVVTDPGNGGAIPVTQHDGVCELVSVGAETRTLAAPTYVGQRLVLSFRTDGGDCVVTCATAFNQAGNTIATFNDAGDVLTFVAIRSSTNLRWRVTANDTVALT
jgi:hypothetical protein